ncbi:class I SAM-dependent methyltransferase [Lachnospiraceae bacterium OttesenSCG-928-D06]|nr:class I SAM-dependent methyltransferase [Lachnospiraceae bacterium OttesenSCG-928-D06]
MDLMSKLNLTWYKGDVYTEGKIEDNILKIVEETEGTDYAEAISAEFSWSAYYHLSDARKNILRWYDFKEDSNVLEIGCGMGAITSLLCDKCREVTAVELSKRRATAALKRCKGKDNLEIIVGNLNDIDFEKKYDYITLIGVLEYQKSFTDSDNPFVDFLRKTKSLLKPEGKLLIAIENKYGLKYWCGACEDHSMIPFDGINQYKLGNSPAMTFGKKELSDIIEKSGFPYYKYFYPMPDYKFPMYIFTDEYMPRRNQYYEFKPYYLNDASIIANEMDIYYDLVQNQVFDFFANSFLVECAMENIPLNDTLMVSFGNSSRKKDYLLQTSIRADKKVYKQVMNRESERHIGMLHQNLVELKERGVLVVNSELVNDKQISQYIKGETLEEVIVADGKAKKGDNILKYFQILYQDILKSSRHVDCEYTALHEARILQGKQDLGIILEKGYIDMLPRNCFVEGDALIFFDQEFSYSNVPAKYILYKAICDVYGKHNWLEEVCLFKYLLQEFGLEQHVSIFNEFERFFIDDILGRDQHSQYYYFRKSIDYKKNVKKLFEKNKYLLYEIKDKVAGMVAKKEFAELYQFFITNNMHLIQDKEIETLQKILEIYGYETSKNISFSFYDAENLNDMMMRYNEVVAWMRILRQQKEDIMMEEHVIKEIKKIGISGYALLIIIESEITGQDKNRLQKKIVKQYDC